MATLMATVDKYATADTSMKIQVVLDDTGKVLSAPPSKTANKSSHNQNN